MTIAALPPGIADALKRGATVLTPGQRAAHVLSRACEDPEPAIYPLGRWMQKLWAARTLTGEADRLLLNGAQEAVLWRQAIAADSEVSALRSLDSLADLASSAYTTLLLHGGRSELAGHAQTVDSKAFLRWTEIFERMLRSQNACTGAEIPALLAAVLKREGASLAEREILLVDFDIVLPAYRSLFEQLEHCGCSVQSVQSAIPEPQVRTFAADDSADELAQAVHWLRDRLDHDPEARLALIVPNLQPVRSMLERTLNAVLAPEQTGLEGSAALLPFEFSLGKPLAQTSHVSAAFTLLRLAQGRLPLDAITSLLLSPSFGASGTLEEQLAAAEFDARTLRGGRRLRPELSLEGLLRLISRFTGAASMSGLVERLNRLEAMAVEEHLREPKVRQTHARWADGFRSVLQAAGWTDLRKADVRSVRIHQRWESALDELATLDFDGSRPTASEALESLLRITHATVFAPESHDAPVQIMGPLEAGGVPFDGLWFLGAGDLAWPATLSLNPLLPRSLARRLGFAGANPAEDHEQGKLVTRRIAGSAAEAVISFARLVDGQQQRPSPALDGLHASALEPEDVPADPETSLMQTIEDVGPATPLPDRVIRGGAGILEHQAACAFRAFAQYRLGSNELLQPANGLDHGERGNLVHMVMQLFWQELADQRELQALSAEERREFLEQCIDQAMREHLRAAESSWDRAYLRTQKIRLRNLLTPWIEQEMARPPFAVRVSEKTLEDVRLGPLRLTLRVDRIDETADGDLILDYKTGRADPREWRSDRPDKPQLPVYAVLAPEPVAGMAFALLRPGKELGLRGMAASADLFDGKLAPMDTPTFTEQMDRWKEVLTGLAEDFYRGVADVRPKEYPQTCQYCAHRILCRVNPTLLDDGDDTGHDAEQIHG